MIQWMISTNKNFFKKNTLQTLKHQLPTLDEQVLCLTTILVAFIIEHKELLHFFPFFPVIPGGYHAEKK